MKIAETEVSDANSTMLDGYKLGEHLKTATLPDKEMPSSV